MRRVTSELADVEPALAAAEDAWLDARGAGAVTARHARRPGAADRRIGLTGPIGCGKSTVAALARASVGARGRRRGRVAREVLAPGQPGPRRRPRAVRRQRSGPDGTLDRAALGRLVFGDPRRSPISRRSSIRPSGRGSSRRSRRADEAAPAVVIEAIKLVEGGLAALCDEVWLVTCDAGRPAGAASSVAAPTRTTPSADRRPGATSPTRLRPVATRVIDTSADLATTREAVSAAIAATLGRAPA